MITRFLCCAGPIICETYVKDHARTYTMEKLRENDFNFLNHREARYAADVIFWQVNGPSDTPSKERVFWSGKTTCMASRQKFLYFCNGLELVYTKWKPGFTSDIEIFRKSLRWHDIQFSKMEDKSTIFQDTGKLHETYSCHWEIICSKEYTGLTKNVRAFIAVRGSASGWLTVAEKLRNKKNQLTGLLLKKSVGDFANSNCLGRNESRAKTSMIYLLNSDLLQQTCTFH